mgnify:CR=1 FL=1
MNNEIIENAKEELDEIAELLYQENISSAYQKIINVLPRLDLAFAEVGEGAARDNLTEKLNLMLEAMENEDYLLMADVIKYELLEAMDDL